MALTWGRHYIYERVGRVQLLNKEGLMTKTMTALILLLSPSIATLSVPGFAFASSPLSPSCVGDSGRDLPMNDDQVLQWKNTTPNQTLKRAHVTGVLTQVYPERNGHAHFEIKIGPTSSDTLEIVYNKSFGALPQLHPGIAVEACGDYITSNAPTPQYQPSPDGAILHWIHRNPSGRGHASGFVILDGGVYGQGAGQGGG